MFRSSIPSIVTFDTSSFIEEPGFITPLDSNSKTPYTDYLSEALLFLKPGYDREKYI